MTTDDTVIEYRADTLGVISALLAGYSGGITIVREMAQNADDVPGDDDRWLEFHFHPEKLIIRNNTRFRDIDFENINNIARGGKRLENRNTIGAFGVGFVSVYQLTDTPILRSSGRELQFFPATGQARQRGSAVVDYTEFELPYRRQASEVGNRLGMPPVTELWVKEIKQRLPDEAFRLLFFLRRLNRVAMYVNDQLQIEVRRSVVLSDQAGQPDQLQILMTDDQGRELRTTWLRYTGKVRAAAPRRPNGQGAKDQTVQIVIPDRDVPDAFMRDHMTGRLYNYLPTDIETKLPFHINGDFYPSTDRKSIDNDHPNHRDWNSWVFRGIGECLAAALPALLERFADEPEKLYQRLPIKAATPLVMPIVDLFLEAAREQPIFYTYDGWRRAERTCWVAKDLRPVADTVDLRLMAQPLQTAAWELINKFGVKEYTLSDHLRRLTSDLGISGKPLSDGPHYLRTPEQLEQLYHVFENEFARREDAKIAETPVFLDHQGLLWRATECVQTSDATLVESLTESGLHFWAGDARRFRYTAALIPTFALPALWNAIRAQISNEKPLRDAPSWIDTPAKLYRLYRTILRTREAIEAADLVGTAICLSRDGRLCFPETLSIPDGEPILYEILRDVSDAPLVAKEIYESREFRTLYEECGVKRFDWMQLVAQLNQFASAESLIDQAHPALNTREKLLRLYRYLLDKRDAIRSHPQALNELLRLPIWLCQDGVLRAGSGRSLPPESADLPDCIRVNQVLDITSSDRLRPLVELLGILPLSDERFILQYLLPQLGSLSLQEHMAVLRYLRTQVDLIGSSSEVLAAAKQSVQIRGDDDRMHPLSQLCYPREQTRSVFGERLWHPHAVYFGQSAPPKDPENWMWYRLFVKLGFHIHAPPNVVRDRIFELTSQRKPIETRDRVEEVFHYLEGLWEVYVETALVDQLLTMRWLPAENDSERWYPPAELYMQTQKRLVDQVGKVLGFRETQLPLQGIRAALRFPTADPRIVVRQLIKLSEQNLPAVDQIYDFLNTSTVTRDDLRPLKGLAVIYDRNQRRYWRPEEIFLTDQRHLFGAYRGYVGDLASRSFCEAIGALQAPRPEDFRDLILELSAQFQAAKLPPAEMRLVILAYAKLADAPDSTIEPLRHKACVVSRAGEEDYFFRLPSTVVFQPPEEIAQALPGLPVAQYNLPEEQPHRAEKLLQRIGVRKVDDPAVLTVEFPFTPSIDNQALVVSRLSSLKHAIRRLLYHHEAFARETEVHERLKRLRCYYQATIQVKYQVRLGTQVFTSALLNRDVHRDHVNPDIYYLRERLNEREQCAALARVMVDVLGLPTVSRALLRDLIVSPDAEATKKILDEEQIRQLPPILVIPPDAPSVLPLPPLGAEPPRPTEPGPVPSNTTNGTTPSSGSAIGNPNSGKGPDGGSEREHGNGPGSGHTANGHSTSPASVDRSGKRTTAGQHSNDQDQRTKGDTSGAEQSKPPASGQNGNGQSTRGVSPSTPITRPKDSTDGQPSTPPPASGASKRQGGTSNGIPGTQNGTQSSVKAGPALPADAPRFPYHTVFFSPTLPTDMERLRRDAETWSRLRGINPDQPTGEDLPPIPAWRPSQPHTPRSEPGEASVARFVLSFAEWQHGFLRLGAPARTLFPAMPAKIDCSTEDGRRFSLWIDWQRRVPIAYNDPAKPALAEYLSSQGIPAGGIVYLEHLYGDEYRLFYHADPHVVRAVRIAWNDQGKVRYEMIEQVEVPCETVEAIYRAEKRHEDQAALWLEAVGKKSIVETLCDLFMASDELWIHEDDLAALVLLTAERMVAAGTVRQTLRGKPFFETGGDGFWRLNAASLINPPRNEALLGWLRASHTLLAAEDAVLIAGRDPLRSALRDLRERLRQVDLQIAPVALSNGIADLITQINADPYYDVIGNLVTQQIERRIQCAGLQIEQDELLRSICSSVNETVWAHVLRPVFQHHLRAMERANQYQLRAALGRLWASFDSAHGLDLRQLEDDAQVWQIIDLPEPTVSDVLGALALSPSMTAAREKLHIAVQLALRLRSAQDWLVGGNGPAAAQAYIDHVKSQVEARKLLALDHQHYFDETAHECGGALWSLLDEHGKVWLSLQLSKPDIAPMAKLKLNQLEQLVSYLSEVRRQDPLRGLLLGLEIWERCNEVDYLAQRVAGELAACHIELQIWELTNNRPWRASLSQKLTQALRQGCEMNKATHIERLQSLKRQLQQADMSWMGDLLDERRRAFLKFIERDIQLVLA